MNKLSIRQYIERYYPDYYSWHTYLADKCISIRGTKEEWGVLGNFYATPVEVLGVTFCNTEQLFQMMKFSDEESLNDIYRAKGMTIKMKAKKWQKAGRARVDWGEMIVDAMKFCLQAKYEQCEAFREELERSNGMFIVEDESGRKGTTWGTQLKEGSYVGSNLLGRLLMELRNNKHLDYHLPTDAFDFIHLLQL